MADSSDALWLSIVAGLVFLVWGYHCFRAVRLTINTRSFRNFRNAFIAVMLQVGMFRIWIASAITLAPDEPWLNLMQQFTAPLLSLLLLSGGFVVAYTWWREP